jgi:cytochrome o ubiquinol oxidase, subunit I
MFEQSDTAKLLLGRLTWEAMPFHEPVLNAVFIAVALGGLALVASMSFFGMWGRFWRNWVTSVDHKRIGIMHVVLGLAMLLPPPARGGGGGADAEPAACPVLR